MTKIFRGQSAIEYLMTYGWALLVLVVVIALIYSTGIFSPSYLISEECSLGPKFPCRFLLHREGGNTRLDMAVDNGFGYAIKILTVGVDTELSGPMDVTALPGEALQSGDEGQISAVLDGVDLDKGSTQVLRVQIEYYSCAPEVNPGCIEPDEGSNARHIISGRIVAKVN